MKLFRIAAVLFLVLAASLSAVKPASAIGCPLLIACRWYVDLGCECDLYYCNGQYHCARPFN